ncbi:hypothetical protein [Leptospira sp. GIMC2001]|uniref:hypothetical protein n=1 Tax=Leptospira sp. GIMC2001 TaxID=1513297 RepID=UPI002349AC01|nr:hypothetical protein [Leptospira sp. GIMC2001]WCL49543.1 hypothetical protein O4O04_01630 [Leptospira sp. GIMC2001]
MKKILVLIILALFVSNCEAEKNDDDENLALALLLASSSSGPSCQVSITINNRVREVPAPITAFSSTEVGQTKSVSKAKVSPFGIDHEIGVVTLTARVGSRITFSGQHYVLVYKKAGGCPIGTSDLATINTSFSHSTALDSSSALASSYLATSSNAITFNEAGEFLVVVYTGVTFSGTTAVTATLTTF